jgi:RNA polymerase sigma factor (sigma-70 family)
MLARTTSASSSIERLLPRARAAVIGMGRALSGEETGGRKNGYQREDEETTVAILAGPADTPETTMSKELITPVGVETDDAVYRDHYELLLFIAAGRFRIPFADAENVVHDVFLRFLKNRQRVTSTRAWLVAAVSNAARDYWRAPQRREGGAIPERATTPSDRLCAAIDATTLMDLLPAKCREVLSRRYCEGCSVEELATEYDTTTGYAKVMVHRCLVAARAIVDATRQQV